ncbi:YbaY family lipoprotein [Nocardioides coralli]|uniref:YbaY family lipoprotein n=1 Tax=Nocardioides coralli TaxID=2872154 RepID=UPI001CA3AD18|nr:YbaY family lipoprotein [Nocardioides coralli]QZY29867.1 YbaY family lipoprotein [Nocardioides coralli]
MRLHGTLRMPDDHALHGHEVARVRLLDVSRADAPAVTVAETSIGLVGTALAVDFDLDVPSLDPRATYALSAHVDTNGSGDVSVGDLLTMQHVGVSPTATDHSYDVPLQTVT